jgi:hypothetical protein
MQFRDQTLLRMKKFGGDNVDSLASKGKSKNHLAALASDHLDAIT